MKSQAAVFVISLLGLWSYVSGHGYVTGPIKPRNVVTVGPSYCPQCANGPNVCGDGAGSQWVTSSEPSKLDGEYTSPVTEVKLGSTLDIKVKITAPHMGHFVMELCRPKGSKITEDCFTTRLLRDPSDTRWSPYLSSDPTAWFFPQNDCTNNDLSARFIVPASFGTCDHCILRWHWQTGNSCRGHPSLGSNAPSEITSWKNGKCKVTTVPQLGSCGSNCPKSSCSGERFKNCIDVKLVGGSSSGESSEPTAKPTTLRTTPPKRTTTKKTKATTTKQQKTTKPADTGCPTGVDLNCDCEPTGSKAYACHCLPK